MMMPVPDVTVDVDPRNPGQFFACCGVLELASLLWPGSEGWFAREGVRAAFHVATNGRHNDPLEEIVHRLCDGEGVVKLAEDLTAQSQADRKPVEIVPFGLRLDWWLDAYDKGDKSELKVWAGQQTPERNLNSLRAKWANLRTCHMATGRDLFAQRAPMTGRFGFDPAASWEAIDVGFSPDEQSVPVQTSPATEILAAIGLQRCRPAQVDGKWRWFAYRAWACPLEIAVVPAAIVGVAPALAAYEFPVVMRNAQYRSFGWAKPLEGKP